MFDVGWSEMLVIAVVLIVVVGPKDLPRMLRQFGRTTSKLRAMAGDFRRQFDEALKEADLDEVKDTLNSARNLNPMNEIRKHLSPLEKVGEEVRAGLESTLKPTPPKPEAAPAVTDTGAGSAAAEKAAPAEPVQAVAASRPAAKAPRAKKAEKPAAVAAPARAPTGKTPAAKTSAGAAKAPAKVVKAAPAGKPARKKATEPAR